jgi:phosphatidylserine/phosphatidylglycerophosphate/cardiolipin synthase-like enzyme
MIMFHLTNPAVVTALVAAQRRGVDVEMILDQENLADHTPTSITEPLKNAGIKVIASSTGFRIGCGVHECQNNGCYGGYYCDVDTGTCASPAKACGH